MSYLVALTTILGIPIALYGYFSAQQTNRVDRTFDFYKDFRATALQEDVNLLAETWNSKADEEKKLLDQKDFDGLAKLVKTLLADKSANAALTRVVIFYDGVSSCLDHSLCDADAAAALLKSPADLVVSMYGSYLRDSQTTNPPFAVGIFKVRDLSESHSIF